MKLQENPKFHWISLSLLVSLFLSGCSPSGTGQADVNIIGGRTLKPTDPFRSSLVSLRKREASLPFCSGVLVAFDLVLTAAHCLKELSTSDLLVSEAVSVGDFGAAVQVKEVMTYQGAESRFFPNGDIGWVRLVSSLSEAMEPIAVLDNSHILAEIDQVLIAGTGAKKSECSDSPEECIGEARVAETKVVSFLDDHYFGSLIVLDSDLSEPQGSCHGDSGGPAYVNLDGRWYLAGIANGKNALLTPEAFSDSTIRCGTGGDIYTFVGGYGRWVEATAGVRLMTREPAQPNSPVTAGDMPFNAIRTWKDWFFFADRQASAWLTKTEIITKIAFAEKDPANRLEYITDFMANSRRLRNTESLSFSGKPMDWSTQKKQDRQLSDLEPIGSLTWLKELKLFGHRFRDTEPLAHLTNLESLAIGGNTDYKSGKFVPYSLSFLENLGNLRKLSLSDHPHGLNLGEIPWAALPYLETLELANIGGLVDLSQIPPVTRKTLQRIVIRRSRVINRELFASEEQSALRLVDCL